MALSLRTPQVSASRTAVRSARPARRVVAAKAGLETNVVISASTLAFLSIGRFAFLPYQRREANFDSSLGPKTTGTTYFDNLQKPASFTLTTNDPAGFNIIDTFAWGALGHAVGYLVLGVNSL